MLFWLISYNVQAQTDESVDVIPPSPNATSFQQYGQSNIGYYSGTHSFNIPLYTIEEKGIKLPITLNYSGAGGIRVQEMASWVGLGWSLSAGGAVSRTIRDLPDDRQDFGFLDAPSLPSTVESLNDPEYNDYYGTQTQYHYDSEPDKFFYNAGGISGSFFIQKDGSILQIPETNNLIKPIYGNGIEGFEIITDRGIKYKFLSKESSWSNGVGTDITNIIYDVSSWYLTSITNLNETATISLAYEEYDTKRFSEYTLNRVELMPDEKTPRYTETRTKAQRLKTISVTSGTVISFNESSNLRCDLSDEKYLASISVKNGLNTTIKEFSFDYSYFDSGNGSSINDPCNTNVTLNGLYDGDYYKRLKLNSVTEVGKPSYTFEYYDQENLPSRHSYARDHWGFYNGQDNNESLEPISKIPQAWFPSEYNYGDRIFGDANRKSNPVFSKAGILKKIIYPTAGYTSFIYEGNTVNDDRLPNEINNTTEAISSESETIQIEVNLINEPFVRVEVTGPGLPQLSENCNARLYYRNIANGVTKSINLNAKTYFTLTQSGTYEIYYDLIDTIGGCFEDANGDGSLDLPISLNWSYEVLDFHKLAGGVRIAELKNYDHNGDLANYKKIEYLSKDGTSSGSVVTVPVYGYMLTTSIDNGGTYGSQTPINWERTVNTNIPLALTSGSPVGYSRVTVYTDDFGDNGKTVYNYSSPEDYSDWTRGWWISEGDDLFNYNNVKHYTFPPPQTNSREWQRGLLLKKEVYKKKDDNTYFLIKKDTNQYEIFGRISKKNLASPYQDYDNEQSILGLKKIPSENKYKFYRLSSGFVNLKRTVSTSYDDNNESLTVVTDNTYVPDKFSLLRESKVDDGNNIEHKTQLSYTFDYPALQNLSTSDQNAYQILWENNVIAAPIDIVKLANNVLKNRSQTRFRIESDNILKDRQLKANSTEPLHQVISYDRYDNEDNLLQYTNKNGVTTSIIWGYNNRYPVAQIVNATYSQIEGSSANLQNINTAPDVYALLQVLRDELNQSVITGYTYKVGIGIESQVDQNGLVTHYQYDSSGRLINVTDNEESILKQIDYLYIK